MKIIKPTVELWPQPEDWHEQVARAARICYGRESGPKSAEDMCLFLAQRGHNSMFRHGTKYFYAEFDGKDRLPAWLYSTLVATPYASLLYYGSKKKEMSLYFISTNIQYLIDNPRVVKELGKYEVTMSDFIVKATEKNYIKAFNLLRFTVCVTTQIGTSRELNRTSPNCIAEQSTRYVNFGKRGGVTIVEPYWWKEASRWKRAVARTGFKVSEALYCAWLRLGYSPQAARSFLPLETATRVVYTYTVYEWRHIMALRLVGTTGKPHPNAQIAASQIRDAIEPALKAINGIFELMPWQSKEVQKTIDNRNYVK